MKPQYNGIAQSPTQYNDNMIIGLIDVDGRKFPNLALMRLAAWHKANGDVVEWWQGNLFYYDRVYMSKVFSNAYTQEKDDPINCGEVIRGGTGYCISLDENGKEVFDQTKNINLPPEVEKMFPDYSIYPEYNFAVAKTSIGCPRGCPFCIVAPKEGRCSKKVADVSAFWNGQPHIEILDPNITACKEKRELFRQYAETGATLNFNQGLDIRFLTDEDIEQLNGMRLKNIHFAWDNPKEDLESAFINYAKKTTHKPSGQYGTVYVLTNYNSSMEENLTRVQILRDLNFDPYIMIYNKPDAPKEIKQLQRWVNNKRIFWACKSFEEYLNYERKN